ncbi:hypothetical protein V1517DRAFT_374229 [Lipomyces orientalis]|uniref:Uncharacterized protein n=1 Tax=Lipomyces orientalis TaxID=1233043 RepID=A0ACC3TM43_9ASCO
MAISITKWLCQFRESVDKIFLSQAHAEAFHEAFGRGHPRCNLGMIGSQHSNGKCNASYENPKAPFLENIVENLNRLAQGVQDMIGQDQTIIGRAAVAAARMAEEAPSKYWVVEQADIVKLGRDEWKE